MLSHKRLFLLLPVALVAGVLGFFVARHLLKPGTTPSETPVDSKTDADSTDSNLASPAETSDAPVSSSNSDNPDGKTPERYDGDNPNTLDDLTGVISTARFASDGTFLVRVNIDQYLSSGSCRLKITDNEGTTPVEKSVEIIPEASTSTCAGFDLPASDLEPFATPLTVEVLLSSGDKTGTLSTIYK